MNLYDKELLTTQLSHSLYSY